MPAEVYWYCIIRQETAPTTVKSGYLWVQTDASDNDIACWVYLAGSWVQLASAP